MASVVVANGAYKSGSTWAFRLTSGLLNAVPIPERWRRSDWSNPSVHESDLEEFLTWAVDAEGGPFCFKAHYRREVEADILRRLGIPVVNIRRDLRDVLVSSYFHERRLGADVGATVDEYFTSHGGRRFIDVIVRYQSLWSSSRPGVFVLGYERLIDDPAGETMHLAEWLGVDATRERVDKLVARNSFATSRAAERGQRPDAEGYFFRKGIVGDWVEHLSEAIAAELAALDATLPQPSAAGTP